MRSVWTVIVLALILAAFSALRGVFSTKTLMALCGLVLIGALWPPAGVVIGGVALLAVGLEQGPALLSQLQGASAASTTPASSGPGATAGGTGGDYIS